MFAWFPPVPSGSVTIVIESTEPCANEACCGRKFDPHLTKPSFVNLTSAEWSEFTSEMEQLVRTYKAEGVSSFGLLLVLVGFLLFHPSFGPLAQRTNLPTGLSIGLLMAVMMGSVLGTVGLSVHLRKLNMQVDARITDLCARVSNASAFFLYHTAFTSPCKPKGARTFRALVISPSNPEDAVPSYGSFEGLQMTAAAVMQGVPVASATLVAPAQQQPTRTITCPASAKAGDSIRIAGPSGQTFRVVVPAGINPGDQFMVEMPREQSVPVTAVARAIPVPV